MNADKLCPFKPGDTVVYKPSVRGRGLTGMTDLAVLEPGAQYKVAQIQQDYYLVLEGFEDSPGGGLHWTEFATES